MLRPLMLVYAAALLASENASDAVFKEFAKPGSPGCAAGVMRDGRVLLAKGYGMGDLEQSVPLSARSVFYMGSVSKQFTAFSILLLEQQGKLSVDDLIGKYVPSLPAHTATATLRQLLSHTSGVRDYLTLGVLAGFPSDHVWTEHAALRWIIRQQAANFEPGTEYLYSNSGYVLLALAAQKVIGGKFNDWMKNQVYGPLGMTSSRWQHDHRDPVANRAHGYVASGTEWKISDSMLDTVGGGGMYSSIEDMLRWALNFDEPKLGAPLLARMSQTASLADGKPIANGYGMGLSRTSYRGLELISHAGSLAGYRTMFYRVPGRKFTVICLCNTASANPAVLAQQLADVWLGSDFPERPKAAAGNMAQPPRNIQPLDAATQAAVAGSWWSDELATVYRIFSQAGKLMLEVGDEPAVELFGIGDGKLGPQRTAVSLSPRKDAAGHVTALVLEAGRVRGIVFLRRQLLLRLARPGAPHSLCVARTPQIGAELRRPPQYPDRG